MESESGEERRRHNLSNESLPPAISRLSTNIEEAAAEMSSETTTL